MPLTFILWFWIAPLLSVIHSSRDSSGVKYYYFFLNWISYCVERMTRNKGQNKYCTWISRRSLRFQRFAEYRIGIPPRPRSVQLFIYKPFKNCDCSKTGGGGNNKKYTVSNLSFYTEFIVQYLISQNSFNTCLNQIHFYDKILNELMFFQLE